MSRALCNFVYAFDVLLHYMERRLDVQKNESHVHGDELDIFAAYLLNRLQPERIWKEDGRQYHQAMLFGLAKAVFPSAWRLSVRPTQNRPFSPSP